MPLGGTRSRRTEAPYHIPSRSISDTFSLLVPASPQDPVAVPQPLHSCHPGTATPGQGTFELRRSGAAELLPRAHGPGPRPADDRSTSSRGRTPRLLAQRSGAAAGLSDTAHPWRSRPLMSESVSEPAEVSSTLVVNTCRSRLNKSSTYSCSNPPFASVPS